MIAGRPDPFCRERPLQGFGGSLRRDLGSFLAQEWTNNNLPMERFNTLIDEYSLEERQKARRKNGSVASRH